MREIATTEELDQALADANGSPLFLYKHSTACPVSGVVLDRIRELLAAPAPEGFPEFVMVKVIESRPVSNEIAARTGVTHRSPQLILVSGGRALWSTSHFSITAEAIAAAVKQHIG